MFTELSGIFQDFADKTVTFLAFLLVFSGKEAYNEKN